MKFISVLYTILTLLSHLDMEKMGISVHIYIYMCMYVCKLVDYLIVYNTDSEANLTKYVFTILMLNYDLYRKL